MSPGPAHPDLVVDLVGQEAKPLACIAMVRAELQRAGLSEAAERFTREALGAGPEEVLTLASRYVTVLR